MNRTLRFFGRYGAICLVIAFVMYGCREDDGVIDTLPDTGLTKSYSHDVVLQWNNLILEVERFTPGYVPPVAARTFGYIGLAAYETAVPGMPDYRSLAPHYPGLDIPPASTETEIHFPAALNSAYLTLVIKFYPTAPAAQLSKVLALHGLLSDRYKKETTPEVFAASVGWGTSVAEAVYAWSKTDVVGHEAWLRNTDPSYVPPAGDGLWQPTYPDYAPALLPYWGQVRTFAAGIDDQCPPPIPYSELETSELYVQARETLNKVNLIRQGQNYEDHWIAEFWSDDCPARTFTPAGRWIAIANQALEHVDANLEKAVVVCAKVGMAICDAGIRCWGEKFRYNVLRPIEYIHDVFGQSDWNTIMCPDGSGQFFTPAFPSYPSGHGTFGSAAAEVLTAEFGQHFAMTDACHQGRTDFLSTPRTYESFYEMAGENAYSRIPLGVHFRMDAEAAADLGYKIGRKVNNLPWK